MIETKDIKKMVSHILKRDQGIADTQIMHPSREWLTGLGIATVIVALGSWFCFYIYLSHQSEMQAEVVVTEQAVPYQAAVVKSALELFAAKEKKFKAILGNDVPVILPVLDQSSTTASSSDETDIATTTEEVPEMIIDPPPPKEDEIIEPAMLAP